MNGREVLLENKIAVWKYCWAQDEGQHNVVEDVHILEFVKVPFDAVQRPELRSADTAPNGHADPATVPHLPDVNGMEPVIKQRRCNVI